MLSLEFNSISGRCLLMCFLYSVDQHQHFFSWIFHGFVDNSGSVWKTEMPTGKKSSERGDLDVSYGQA